MFERFRQRLQERGVERQRREFERAAAESAPEGEFTGDDRRARDLPDPLGEFNEMERMGPSITAGGGTGV